MSSKIEKDSLGGRMKEYEFITRNSLIRNLPVIVRLDGKAFHSFTKGFEKPFDNIISTCMIGTMEGLCKFAQGCKLGYTQSDEISLFIHDYDTIKTSPFLKNNIQKIVSILSSRATNLFNSYLISLMASMDESDSRKDLIRKKMFKAEFDCRVFNLPESEVTNYFIWRQQDATRNSIQSLGQKYYSHKELNKVNTKEIQNKLFIDYGINWNDLSTYLKRGTACKKYIKDSNWTIDYDTPIFTKDREYIESEIIGNEDLIESFLNNSKVGDIINPFHLLRLESLSPKLCKIKFIHESEYNNYRDIIRDSEYTVICYLFRNGKKYITKKI